MSGRVRTVFLLRLGDECLQHSHGLEPDGDVGVAGGLSAAVQQMADDGRADAVDERRRHAQLAVLKD